MCRDNEYDNNFYWLLVHDSIMCYRSHYLSQKDSLSIVAALIRWYSEYESDPEDVVVLPSCYIQRGSCDMIVQRRRLDSEYGKGEIAKARDRDLLPEF